jgi:hypothetical protein
MFPAKWSEGSRVLEYLAIALLFAFTCWALLWFMR